MLRFSHGKSVTNSSIIIDFFFQVRKSASIHAHSSLRPTRVVPGAQPTHHYSNGAVVAVVAGGGGINGGVRYKNVHANRNSYCFSPPPIPDPDYSQSDEESEQNKKAYKTSTLPLPGSRKMMANKVTVRAAVDTTNVTQSFNVEEIRKARSLLRSSTPFSPNYTTLINTATEDGDNSSSGVSSDQEISAAAQNGDKNSLNSTMTKSASSSFIQLPPLGSTDTSAICEPKASDLVVLPPPEFVGNVIPAAVEVLEPPPQFSDDQTCK